MATARIYFNWMNLSNVLYRYDAYIWLCDSPDRSHGPAEPKCPEQEEAISDLFLACLASAFSFSLVAGTLLDYVGPKITGILGQLIGAIAWLMLSFASERHNTLLAGFVFVGLGSDTGFLPSLPIANLFPGNEGLVVAFLGAAKSISFAVPVFMDMAAKNEPALSWDQLCLWYMGFGPLLCCCVATLLFPVKSYLPWNEFAMDLSDDDLPVELVNATEYSPPQHRLSIKAFANQTRRLSITAASHHSGGHHSGHRRSAVDSVVSFSSFHKGLATDVDWEQRKGVLLDTCNTKTSELNTEEGGGEAVTTTATTATSITVPQLCVGECDGQVAGADANTLHADQDDNDDEYGLKSTAPITSAAGTASADVGAVVTSTFRQQYLSIFNVGITIYAIFRALMYAFFTTSMEHLVGHNPKQVAGTISPLSFIPCLVIGKMVDWWGIMVVMCVLNSCITVAYGFSMVSMAGVEAAGYVAIVLYTAYVSFYSSQLYCYVSDTFEARHFGKFVGITSMVAGLCGLLKKPLGQLARDTFNNNYYYPAIIMLGICGINFGILIFLIFKKRRNPHPFWPKKQQDPAKTVSESPAEAKTA
eukprot:GHVS01032891.1.p1 GENE.GHVS01032891.1~~GHVS01032891.1.p1  ORF type:complete len:643 (+),score=124.32 GHVS01032891.1:168-1931(+)